MSNDREATRADASASPGRKDRAANATSNVESRSRPESESEPEHDIANVDGGWVQRAERAAERGRSDDPALVVLSGHAPPLIDDEGRKAVLAPFLASLVWASAIFREQVAGTSIDPLAMLLRALAYGLTFRVGYLLYLVASRWRAFAGAAQHRLVLAEQGLFVRTPEGDRVVPKEQIVGVMERDAREPRGPRKQWRDVYVALDGQLGIPFLTLPPVFDGSPALLADRLTTWLGPREPEERGRTEAAPLASELWDQAVAGKAPEGVLVLRHGLTWLLDAPFALLAVALTVSDGLLRAGPSAWDVVDPLIGGGLAFTLFAIPTRWLWVTRREVSPRGGVAMVITDHETLIKTRHGMIRAPHARLVQVSVDVKRKWSLLQGAHRYRVLVMLREGTDAIRYDEVTLGLPAEAVQLLLEAYRRGWLPR